MHNIIRVGISVSQLKGIMRICYKDYYEYYKTSIEKSISPQSLSKFIEGFSDKDSFYATLKELYNKVIIRVLSNSEDSESIVHFIGNGSGVTLQNPNFKSSKTFTIVMHLRTENLNDSQQLESPSKGSAKKSPHQHAQTMDKERLNSTRNKIEEQQR